MIDPRDPTVILMAEDDPDDRLLARDALDQSRLGNDLRIVRDGEELLDYLRHRHDYAEPTDAPRPAIILLDLNMPRMDGREVLRELKTDPELRRIPVVVLTTSKDYDDLVRCYDLGANSFITKPASFQGLVDVMVGLGRYWFEIVELPDDRDG